MHTISMNINELKYMIEKKLQHPYVEIFVKKPFVDEDKLEILHYLYQDIQMPTVVKQQHILTIMLVQIALDTHEQIANQRQDDIMSEKEKQLAVLAGDYYSGLYYLLLSEVEEIKMVQVLASAIRQINERKMTLFYEEFPSSDQLMELINHVETTLFTDVAQFLNTDQQIIDVIQEILFLNRLNREQETDGIVSKYLNGQRQHSNDKNNTMFHINELYRHHKQHLERLLVRLPYEHLHFSNAIRHKFSLAYHTSVAEEG